MNVQISNNNSGDFQTQEHSFSQNAIGCSRYEPEPWPVCQYVNIGKGDTTMYHTTASDISYLGVISLIKVMYSCNQLFGNLAKMLLFHSYKDITARALFYIRTSFRDSNHCLLQNPLFLGSESFSCFPSWRIVMTKQKHFSPKLKCCLEN